MLPAATPLPRRSRFFRLFLAILLGVALAGGIGSYFWLRVVVPDPPSISLEDADPPAILAIQKATAEIKKSPRSAAAWGQLGMAFLANDYLTEATVCFATAERLDPRNPQWPYLQVIRLSPNDPDAIGKLERSVELAGNKPTTPRLRLADALMGAGRREQAEAQLRAVLQVEPTNPRAYLGLARIEYEKGDLKESETLLRQAADRPYTQKAAHILLAKVHQGLGDQPAAIEDARLAVQLPEDRPWPDPFTDEVSALQRDRNALDEANTLMERGNVPQALGILERLVHNHPSWAEAWHKLGVGLIAIQHYPAGEQALEKAVVLAPRSAKYEHSLAIAFLTQGKMKEAEAHLKLALDLQPNYPRALYNLNICQQNLKDQKAAIGSLRTALRYQPDFAEAHLVLGQLLFAAGQKDEGLAHLRSAARLRPDHAKTKKLLAEFQGSAKAP